MSGLSAQNLDFVGISHVKVEFIPLQKRTVSIVVAINSWSKTQPRFEWYISFTKPRICILQPRRNIGENRNIVAKI